MRIAITGMARIDKRSVAEWLELADRSSYRAVILSQALGVCPRQLRRYTKQAFGCSPQEWLDEVRLARAAGMLRKYRSIKGVSFTLGFKQISHFSREFKLYYGIPPSEFLRWDEKQKNFGIKE